MSGQHFRFLHAGGFLLDQPLCGLVEIPEPLTDLLIDAPFSAAQKVFDTAVEERVVGRLRVSSRQGDLRIARDGEVTDGPDRLHLRAAREPLVVYRP